MFLLCSDVAVTFLRCSSCVLIFLCASHVALMLIWFVVFNQWGAFWLDRLFLEYLLSVDLPSGILWHPWSPRPPRTCWWHWGHAEDGSDGWGWRSRVGRTTGGGGERWTARSYRTKRCSGTKRRSCECLIATALGVWLHSLTSPSDWATEKALMIFCLFPWQQFVFLLSGASGAERQPGHTRGDWSQRTPRAGWNSRTTWNWGSRATRI